MLKSEFKTFGLEISDLLIEESNIARALGYGDGIRPEHISTLINQYISESKYYAKIKTGYCFYPIDFIDAKIHQIGIAEEVFSTNRTITRELNKSAHAAIYVITLGTNFDNWSSELFKSDEPLAGYIVDTIGSELVELSAHWLELQIESSIEIEGLKCTHAHSPGYCDWLVDEQHKLFSLLPDNPCGITLSPTALMVPIKSLSGIIGIGSDVKKGSHPCSICAMRNCYRRMHAYSPDTSNNIS